MIGAISALVDSIDSHIIVRMIRESKRISNLLHFRAFQFLVAQGPPLSSDISKTNENGEGKICQCICTDNRSHWAEFEQNR